jgi:FMN phosphatase YigB (HAD superfamily)
VANITALLFDFGGTLDGPKHWLDRFLGQYRAAAIEISREELDPAFDYATGIGYRTSKVIARFGLTDLVRFLVGQQFEYLRKSGPERIRAMLEEVGAKGRHRIVETVTSSFVRETLAGLEHSRAVLSAINGRFKMGVVSNFYGNLELILTESRLAGYIKTVVDSSRVGIFKPDPGIYRAALKQLNAPAENTAMIGDSPEKDLAPARQLGMRTVWFRDESNRIPKNPQVADLTIESLDELTEMRSQ